MPKTAVQFVCSECGTAHPRWSGRCNECGAWNSPEETGISRIEDAIASTLTPETKHG